MKIAKFTLHKIADYVIFDAITILKNSSFLNDILNYVIYPKYFVLSKFGFKFYSICNGNYERVHKYFIFHELKYMF